MKRKYAAAAAPLRYVTTTSVQHASGAREFHTSETLAPAAMAGAGAGAAATVWPAVCNPRAPAGEAPLPLSKQTRTGRLDNGLTWYVRQNSEPRARPAAATKNRVVFCVARALNAAAQSRVIRYRCGQGNLRAAC